MSTKTREAVPGPNGLLILTMIFPMRMMLWWKWFANKLTQCMGGSTSGLRPWPKFNSKLPLCWTCSTPSSGKQVPILTTVNFRVSLLPSEWHPIDSEILSSNQFFNRIMRSMLLRNREVRFIQIKVEVVSTASTNYVRWGGGGMAISQFFTITIGRQFSVMLTFGCYKHFG